MLGYSSFRGQVLDSTDLADIIAGLRENGLLANYSHILTGTNIVHSVLHSTQHIQTVTSPLYMKELAKPHYSSLGDRSPLAFQCRLCRVQVLPTATTQTGEGIEGTEQRCEVWLVGKLAKSTTVLDFIFSLLSSVRRQWSTGKRCM